MSTAEAPLSKTNQIISLSLEVLQDAETPRTSVESIVLKASRLARLVNDEEVVRWLLHEILGYNSMEEISLKYVNLTRRWIDKDKSKAHWGPTVFYENLLSTTQQKVDAIKAFIATAPRTRDNQLRQITAVFDNARTATLIVSAVRAQIQQFATRIYHEHLFSRQAETIFAQYQKEVDARLAAIAEGAFDRLPHAFERLGAGDSEAISHALTTCRRVVDSFANTVYPPRAEPVRIGDEVFEVAAPHTRNRLRVYVYEQIGKGSRYERIIKAIALFIIDFLLAFMMK